MSDAPRRTLFVGGHVFDGHRRRPGHAVLVQGLRIVDTGPADRVLERVADLDGPVERVDLRGGLIMPGFHDAHCHPLVGGLERLRCEMSGLSRPEEYLTAIGDAARRRHGDQWVRGGGWSVDAFDQRGPTAELLDRVVPDRPAFLPSTDHHDAWVNTRALEVAGVNRDTPDPADGWIERDEHGHPTGTLREAAMALVHDHVTRSREEDADALREAQRCLHGWGVTGWHDALIGGYAGLDDPTQAYLDLLEADQLSATVRCSQWWDRARCGDDDAIAAQVGELVQRRDELAARGLDAGSVKVMMDGISETFTATLTDGYDDLHGCPCGDHGLPFLSESAARASVSALHAAGLQCHFHAIGDAAVHTALDAVEQAQREHGLRDLRHQIAHLQLVRPSDRHRFGDLQVVANLQGMWARRETPAVTLLAPHLDAERFGWHYPFRDVLEGRARFSGGSDWPVNPPEPLGAVHVLVNRRAWASDPAQLTEPLVLDQTIGLEQALSAYTRGSAWADHRVDAGFVHVGARADLVVLDRDPFTLPSSEIGACEVASTWAGGRCVYER
ncbi:amidohydrolase [Nocardioides acrostichi]|uniref:Amidohydrolase n=1 Tax=Nocardioides acrostichi TaxID=2784339 RepID=A0A930YBV7_9ACTN|nr:amidohydrolase [Nocardioides acrostichi]MBF4160854.1 amidohydrolase [Nocardioides acrostichi]